jgi:hypothetical protein
MTNKEVTVKIQEISDPAANTAVTRDEKTAIKESYWSASALSDLIDFSPTALTPLDEW